MKMISPQSRKLVDDILSEFGMSAARLTHLTSRHNDVFRVGSTSGARYVLRIQNDRMNDAQAKSQLVWLEALANESDITVPAPVRASDGRPFTIVETPSGRRRAVLVHWLPGKVPERREDRFFIAAAKMIARLHDHSESFRPSRNFVYLRLDAEWLFGKHFFLRTSSPWKRLSRSQRSIANRAEQIVRRTTETLGRPRHRFGLIHADLNLGNIIFHRGKPCPIDFDEFGKGWYLFDLAELIRNSVTPDNWLARMQLVIDPYQTVRPLDAADIAAFDAFLVATFVNYMNWAFAHARDAKDLRWIDFCMDVVQRIARE